MIIRDRNRTRLGCVETTDKTELSSNSLLN